MSSPSEQHDSKPLQFGMVGLAVFAVLVTLIQRYTAIKIDPREPPYLKPSIPWLGHIVGLVKEGANYFQQLEYRFSYSILPSHTSEG